MNMTLELPGPISAYYQADLGESAAVSDCFTEDAVVIDEGRTHIGRKAIQEWKTKSSSTYRYTIEPFSISESGGKTVVTAHLVGNFPGSPVDLRYFFALEGQKIAALEIKL
jgi:ketosteroid isomerase-like protein